MCHPKKPLPGSHRSSRDPHSAKLAKNVAGGASLTFLYYAKALNCCMEKAKPFQCYVLGVSSVEHSACWGQLRVSHTDRLQTLWIQSVWVSQDGGCCAAESSFCHIHDTCNCAMEAGRSTQKCHAMKTWQSHDAPSMRLARV